MNINDKYIVDIIDEDNIGNGIAKIDNYVVFVRNALLNEKVEIIITEVKKNYSFGIINKIINKSDKRINVKCKYYDLCGGCNFLHTSYENEKSIKEKYLNKLFNTKANYLNINNTNNYRNKVVLHVIDGKLGYFNAKTHDLCEIDKCLLLNDKINLKIAEINKYDLTNINEITIRCINNKIMINIVCNDENIDLKNIECDSLYINYKYIKGDKYLIDEINNYKFSIYPDSFYQVNKEGMSNIYNEALNNLEKYDSLLDLYCGTGTIGIWMHDKFNKVTGVDVNESNIANANINKKINNIKNIKFICDDAKNIKGKYDVIVVDPPRSGLSQKVIDYLNDSNSSKIIYISCNPNTLKRDIDLLNKYKMNSISCTDMFPRTKHIEMVCILERK